jgi:ABC-type sugar transport system permease subunit
MDNLHFLRKIINTGYTTLIIILLSAIVGLILAFPVMWLWNFVFGELLRIDVLQAWALNVLAGILFGKAGGSGRK